MAMNDGMKALQDQIKWFPLADGLFKGAEALKAANEGYFGDHAKDFMTKELLSTVLKAKLMLLNKHLFDNNEVNKYVIDKAVGESVDKMLEK